MTRHRTTLDELPLFASDADLAEALLGVTRQVEWEATFAVLSVRVCRRSIRKWADVMCRQCERISISVMD